MNGEWQRKSWLDLYHVGGAPPKGLVDGKWVVVSPCSSLNNKVSRCRWHMIFLVGIPLTFVGKHNNTPKPGTCSTPPSPNSHTWSSPSIHTRSTCVYKVVHPCRVKSFQKLTRDSVMLSHSLEKLWVDDALSCDFYKKNFFLQQATQKAFTT
jgi:hypothetical protein